MPTITTSLQGNYFLPVFGTFGIIIMLFSNVMILSSGMSLPLSAWFNKTSTGSPRKLPFSGINARRFSMSLLSPLIVKFISLVTPRMASFSATTVCVPSLRNYTLASLALKLVSSIVNAGNYIAGSSTALGKESKRSIIKSVSRLNSLKFVTTRPPVADASSLYESP